MCPLIIIITKDTTYVERLGPKCFYSYFQKGTTSLQRLGPKCVNQLFRASTAHSNNLQKRTTFSIKDKGLGPNKLSVSIIQRFHCTLS